MCQLTRPFGQIDVGSRWTFANVLCTQCVPNPDLGLVDQPYQDQLPPHVSGPTSAGTPAGPEIPLSRSQTPCPKMTELASGAITAVDTVTIGADGWDRARFLRRWLRRHAAGQVGCSTNDRHGGSRRRGRAAGSRQKFVDPSILLADYQAKVERLIPASERGPGLTFLMLLLPVAN
jgi:hypothetical protein